MAFARPSRGELIAQAVASVEAASGVSPLPARSILRALSSAIAGVRHLLHGHLDWVYRQLFPSKADGAELDEWAKIKGITARMGPQPATGLVVCLGTDGAIIPQGSQLARSDGAVYTVQAEVTISGGIGIVSVVSDQPGALSNSPGGTGLEFVSPIPGVDSQATVESLGLTGGSDTETDDSLRERLLHSFQHPGQGGSEADYVRWCREVPGVTRAWCLPAIFGAGTVGVTFATDNEPSGPIPTSEKVAEVQAYIEPKDATNAILTVYAPTALPLDLTIQGLTPFTVDVKAAVEAAIRQLLLSDAYPGEPLLRSHIIEAIANAEGEENHLLTVPAADVPTTNQQLLVFGAITYTV